MRLANYWIPEMESAHAAFKQSDAAADVVVAQIKTSLEQTCVRATRDVHAPEQVQDTLYAVVAWIDELAMSFPWAGSGAWRLSPLQRHYFSTTRAGTGFFDRLRNLPEQATQVREVFALVLVTGFQGEFAHRPAIELQQFRSELLQRVATEANMAPLADGKPLFPEAYSLGKQPRMRRSGPSTAAVLTIVLPLLVLLVLYVYLNTQLLGEAADLIAPLTKGL